jgi:FKBP-type peptidyl-prolyl cis-trans isomerase (trigger factor)
MVSKDSKSSSVVAKSDDGTIQITFTIPFSDITETKEHVASEMSPKITVPGFRPGKAPVGEVMKHINENELLEKTLSHILPKLLGDAITEHKIRPAIYPKFELVSAKEGEDWQVRATTCEIPNIDLSDYKEKIKGMNKAKAIWTPGKGDTEPNAKQEDPEATRIKNEQEIIKTLLSSIKINLPKVLVEDEVNARLSKLLERIEKLGLSLDSYLASIGKNPQGLRSEYEAQAKEAISLDLILTKIAEEEKLTVDPKSMEEAIKAGQADPKLGESMDTPERKLIIENILKRRMALDFIASLSN